MIGIGLQLPIGGIGPSFPETGFLLISGADFLLISGTDRFLIA